MTLSLVEKKDSEDLVSRVRKEMKRLKLSQAALGKQWQRSGATVGLWLSGKYTGDVEALDARATAWLTSQTPRITKLTDWLPTPTCDDLVDLLTHAQQQAEIVTISGGAGIGKSHTFAHYAKENPNRAYRIDLTSARGSVSGLIREVADLLKVKSGRMDETERESIKALHGTKAVLLVDEAQLLAPGALETLRRISDLAGCGLVLAGNQRVYTNLFTRQSTAYFAQLRSRISYYKQLTTPTAADVTLFVRHYLTPDDIENAKLLACGPEGFRPLVRAIRAIRQSPEYTLSDAIEEQKDRFYRGPDGEELYHVA